ncbi:hypothetical protein GUJ93_ZPchr0007g6400 [Zizania palustris]|uniref:Uncharacterized protein n=1 Tax=Zizania palustris TaxID=103762 RepID=A0A8J5TCP2_ZIZPA|nr:hypothetical protein GUJ93_ZPchr0007g6400 [Zizania palustris]
MLGFFKKGRLAPLHRSTRRPCLVCMQLDNVGTWQCRLAPHAGYLGSCTRRSCLVCMQFGIVGPWPWQLQTMPGLQMWIARLDA